MKEGYTLPSLCLATVGEIHIHTHRWQGFMKYAIEMGPVAMIYKPTFIKIGSGTQKLIRGRKFTGTQTHRHPDSMEIALAYFLFFKIRKVG
jgi:hypothetical protein